VKVRKRLTILYSAVLAGLFFLFALGLYFSFTYHLRAEVDESLASWSLQVLDSDGSGRLRMPESRTTTSDMDQRSYEMPDTFALALKRDGSLLLNRSAFSEQGIRALLEEAKGKAAGTSYFFSNSAIDSQKYRILVKNVVDSRGDEALLFLGRSLVHVDKSARGLVMSLIVAWLAAVMLGSTVMWVLVGQTIKPVNSMTELALSISQSSDLKGRIIVGPEQDEFSELGRALNRMLEAIELSHEGRKQFLADASHQLRTPLTSVGANLAFISKAETASAHDRKAALDDCMREVGRMSALVNDLLLLARTEAPLARQIVSVDVNELLETAARTFADNVSRHIDLELPVTAPHVLADKNELHHALVMLLDNAKKYSGLESRILLGVEIAGSKIDIFVQDNGPGIPPEETHLAFERFYRGSNVRDRIPGSGLGLAIVKSIVQKNGGVILLANVEPHGLLIRMRFPAAPR
jgi:signal transduction histidine kinase